MAAKKPVKRSSNKKNTSKKSQVVVSRPSIASPLHLSKRIKLLSALVVALVGGYLLFSVFADSPTTSTGMLVSEIDVQPVSATKDANGNAQFSGQEVVFEVLDNNTLVCGDKNSPDTLTTTQLTDQQVSDIANQVINAGIGAQPDEINAPGQSHAGRYTLVSVNANGVNKQVDIYGNANANDFGQAVRAIGRTACKQATQSVPRDQAPKPSHGVDATLNNSKGQKLARLAEQMLTAKAAASGYVVNDETADYRLINAYRSTYAKSPQLTAAGCIRDRARYWSAQMGATNTMYHSANVFNANNSTSVFAYCKVQSTWDAGEENIGWNSCTTVECVRQLTDLMMREVPPDDGHRTNILATNIKYFGVGAYYDTTHNKIWITQDFLNCFNNSCAISTYSPTYTSSAAWSGWVKTGTPAYSSPAVASWQPGRYDIFTCSNGAVYHKTYEDVGSSNTWLGSWQSLGGNCVGSPAAVSWGPGRLDVFTRASDNTLRHLAYSSGWHSWESLGGTVTAPPAVNSSGSGQLSVYVLSTGGTVHYKYWNGAWSGWSGVPGGMVGKYGIATVTRGPLTDVLTIGNTDGALYNNYYNAGWHTWANLGGVLTGAPAVDARDAAHENVYAVGTDNQVHQKYYTTSAGWSAWGPLSGITAATGSTPGASDWSSDHVDVFVEGAEGNLWQNSWHY